MFKLYKLIGIVILVMAMPICLLANTEKDTTIIFYNGNWKSTQKIGIVYESKQWKENGLWYQHDFYYPSLKPQMTGSYADFDRKKKQGIFVWYYQNGTKKDSVTYLNNVENGFQTGWYDNGNISYKNHFKKGIFVDTSINWYENGKESLLIICDGSGNGTEQLFFEEGGKIGGGNLLHGKRNGQWKFFDANKIISQTVNYEMDSAKLIINFDENGAATGRGKFVEKAPEFPGGHNGWQRFLERNLQYPESAQLAGIEGTILFRFVIDKDGTPSNFKIVDGPDAALEKEVLRIMVKSPNWIPSIQYNRNTKYYFIQTINFALQ